MISFIQFLKQFLCCFCVVDFFSCVYRFQYSKVQYRSSIFICNSGFQQGVEFTQLIRELKEVKF